MEYTNLIEPLGFMGISLLIGLFMGAYWMFLMMYKTEKNALEELDAKSKALKECQDRWKNKYVDDDPDGRFTTQTGALSSDHRR